MTEPDEAPGRDRTPGLWVRLGALMVDSLALSAGYLVLRTSGVSSGGSRLLDTAAFVLYHAATVALWGASLGKLAAGIRVVSAGDGRKVSPARALGRAAASVVSISALFLGCAAALLNRRRRALHDYAAGTMLVYAAPAPPKWRRAALASLGVVGAVVPAALAAVLVMLSPSARTAAGLAHASDGHNKGGLASLRAAASFYHADAGAWPLDLQSLVGAGAAPLPALPELRLPEHPPGAGVEEYGAEACLDARSLDASKLRDTGRWGYVGARDAACRGTVFIDCRHADSHGVPWHER